MIVLLLILLAAVYTDYRQKKIPNWIILFGIPSGLLICFIHGGISLMVQGILGMFLPVFLLYPVFMIGTLGAGDLKLFAVVGSYIGIKGVLISLVFAFVTGAVISLMKMIYFHNFKERIYYFISYLSDIFLKGKWRLYENTESISFEKEDNFSNSSNIPGHKIHFALPIFIGVMVYMGGSL